MTKNPFKVGDRVRDYSTCNLFVGVITDINKLTGSLCIATDDGHDIEAWPQAVRRLKPKAPLREFWINKHGGNCPIADEVLVCPVVVLTCEKCRENKVIKVREVRRK